MRFRLATLPALALVVITAPFVNAEAVPLTNSHIEVIRENCTEAQQILKRLQQNEAAARVNRGREYESTLRLMASFNSRVALNKINAPSLSTLTNELEDRFADFRTDHIAYDAQLKRVIQLRCSEQPVSFYDELTIAREARVKVADDINEINDTLDKYGKAVKDLRNRLNNGGSSR